MCDFCNAQLVAAIGVLSDLLPHLSDRDKERLENAIDTLKSVRDLARCVSRYGDKDPLFLTIKSEWTAELRAKRKKKFKNLIFN